MEKPTNYVTYHLHTAYSLIDSCTMYKEYIDHAVELGQKAICFTEHGNIYNWILKKLYCEEKGIKYLHGVEAYLTRSFDEPFEKDNYHTILIAKNYDGVKEINTLVSRSTNSQQYIEPKDPTNHMYYKPRISFDEFLHISKNVIKISACLQSPLNKLSLADPIYEKMLLAYDYLEIQPHIHSKEQIMYNRHLLQCSQQYHIPLIAGTDTHSLNDYKAECRLMLQTAKGFPEYDDEFDLTYKSCDELIEMFRKQDSIPEQFYLEAIENTNRMADSVEDFDLDLSFKYAHLYGDSEADEKMFGETVTRMFNEKVSKGIIKPEQIEGFKSALAEEYRVFKKIDMVGFMLFMSELIVWCKSHGIPIGFNRGSCGGSRTAFVTDITDLNPEQWKTVFSRFANEDRKEIGDIDIDAAPDDREKIYEHIITRFGQAYTGYILSIDTIGDKGTIDEIGRALSNIWKKDNLIDEKAIRKEISAAKEAGQDVTALNKKLKQAKEKNEAKEKENPYNLKVIEAVKAEYSSNPERAKKKHPDIFYYFDGLVNTPIAQSMHPAGIVVSPVSLMDNYGVFVNDNKVILQIDMDSVHEVSLVKYDILGLKNIGIIKDACELAHLPYPKSHEVDWDDQEVWKDMISSPAGIFQFESEFAFSLLKTYEPHSIFDMSLVAASLRPSGKSYRNDLMKHIPKHNPSEMIDDLLKDNYGYLIYQEDVIKFLTDICGFSGSDADNTRRAIGRKDKERLEKALPKILEGYCNKSPKPRATAEKEAAEFVQIIEDASEYMFG